MYVFLRENPVKMFFHVYAQNDVEFVFYRQVYRRSCLLHFFM